MVPLFLAGRYHGPAGHVDAGSRQEKGVRGEEKGAGVAEQGGEGVAESGGDSGESDQGGREGGEAAQAKGCAEEREGDDQAAKVDDGTHRVRWKKKGVAQKSRGSLFPWVGFR